MKNTRRNQTLKLTILVILAAALALGSLWLVEVMRRQTENTLPDKARTDPDFYVENFNFVRMGKNGQARYNLTGTQMLHYPGDDSYLVHNPVMYSYSTDHPSTVSRSKRATVQNNNTEVHMYDDVLVHRPSSPTSRLFELKTSYLLLLPDEDIMKTSKAVELRLGGSTLNGTGMYANNATGEFSLAGSVRGMYPAAGRH